jgi:hypothetical protein
MGELKLRYQPTPELSLLVLGYMSGSEPKVQGVRLSLLGGAPMIGVGYQFLFDSVSLGVEFEAGVEATRFANQQSKTQRFIPILRVDIPVRVHLSKMSYIIASAQLKVATSTTEIYLDGLLLDSTSQLVPSLLVGFGLGF